MSSLSMCRLFRGVHKVEFHISDIIQPCVYIMKCLLQIFYQWNCACVLLHHNKINLLVIKQCLSKSLFSLLSVIYPGSMKLPLSKTVLCAQKKKYSPMNHFILLYLLFRLNMCLWLHLAAGNGHLDVIALLLKHGVNIHHTD